MLQTNKRIERLLKKKAITKKLKDKLSKQIDALSIRKSKLEEIASKPVINEVGNSER